MGRKSIRKNKNIYQLSREHSGLTRQQAQEKMVFVNAERIEKIESGKTGAKADEVLAMSECYRCADLISFYCSKECPIGQRFIPYLQLKDVSDITLQLLASLNRITAQKEQLIAILEDSNISVEEAQSFNDIGNNLDELCRNAQSLRLWLYQQQLNRKK